MQHRFNHRDMNHQTDEMIVFVKGTNDVEEVEERIVWEVKDDEI